MGLFDRHAGLLDAYRDVRTTGADPFQIRMERVLSPTEAIIDGKMGKFYSGICLLEQAFIKKPDQTIQQLLDEKNKALGEKITIRRIVRYMVGEAIA